MDPITVTHLVQDRTTDLQRTADQLRQERALRSAPTTTTTAAEAVAVSVPRAGPANPTRATSKAADCAPAERAA
jgi:hypothetical protein